jgi:hypothetical protein
MDSTEIGWERCGLDIRHLAQVRGNLHHFANKVVSRGVSSLTEKLLPSHEELCFVIS